MADPVFHIYRQADAESDDKFKARVETGLRAASRPFDVQITETVTTWAGRRSTVYIIEDPR